MDTARKKDACRPSREIVRNFFLYRQKRDSTSMFRFCLPQSDRESTVSDCHYRMIRGGSFPVLPLTRYCAIFRNIYYIVLMER